MKGIKIKESDAGIIGKLVIRKYKAGKLIYQSDPMKNKVVSGSGGYGRNLVARALAGDNTYGIVISSASVGDDDTTPTDSDTDLGNPLVTGITITNITVDDDEITVDVFASDATLPDDTYEEFGLFIGTQMFSHLIVSPAYTKASGEDTLFTYTLEITG